MKKMKFFPLMFAAITFIFAACSNVDDPKDPGNGNGNGNSGNNDGTEAKPYTIAQAKNVQDGSYYWVEAYIVGNVDGEGKAIDTESKFEAPFTIKTNILIADSKEEKNYANCMPVQLPQNALRTDLNLVDNAGNLGLKVKLYGSLTSYFKVSGLKDASYYELEGGKTGGTKPGDNILSVPFKDNMGGFTTQNVSGEQVWKIDTQYSNVNMSGFVEGTNHANEDWLISPAIDLSNRTQATLSYSFTISKGKNNTVTQEYMKANQTVWISDNYTTGLPSTATWTKLEYNDFPTGTDWVYVPTSIVIPQNMLGKAGVVIAFKYTCDDTDSATWQIRDLFVR